MQKAKSCNQQAAKAATNKAKRQAVHYNQNLEMHQNAIMRKCNPANTERNS